MSHPAVLATGFVALDIIHPAGGGAPVRAVGGPCGNVGANLAVLGTPVRLLARIGADAEAAHILAELSAFGIDTRSVRRDPAIRTPVVLQRNAAPGADGPDHDFFFQYPETGEWVPRFTSITTDAVAAALRGDERHALVYADRISPPILALLDGMRRRGARLYVEPTGTDDPALLRDALAIADIVKCAAPQIEEALLPPSVPLRVRTIGADGLRYSLRGGAWRHLPALVCDSLVDSAGAGDALSAALVARLVSSPDGAALDEALVQAGLREGQRLAAHACAHLGAGGWRLAAMGRRG